MRVTGDWLSARHVQRVLALLEDGGHQALLVGGCVRDALMGLPVGDIDIATDALPDRVIGLAKAVGVKAIPTGIDHGTVTLVVDNAPHEVTTFRKDVETDGRHAVVAFSDDVSTDAARRDFTMNALYARADGTVVDPLGGLADLEARRVRFIGDAAARIEEDYLRILRYFRFAARFQDPADGHDPETLAVIAAHLDGLERLSDERITSEMVKLLGAPHAAETLGVMDQCGVLGQVLPGAHVPSFTQLVHLAGQNGSTANLAARLASLRAPEGISRLRLDKATARDWATYRETAEGKVGTAELAYRLGAEAAEQITLLRAALLGQSCPPYTDDIAKGAAARFPVTAADLMPALEGKALGDKLRALEARWIASDFTLDRDALLG
ncbi:CCA tRNA nucleotidyltransferase [Pseudaestuariivita sp.]|uniref:CCA tRNA nucleotidyltransferase n=1 Tax=Pseudaestuariivita sp. TaxID=2211669 RepID=UPI00405A05D2